MIVESIDEHVARPRLVRRNVHERRRRQRRHVDPVGVHEKASVGQRAARRLEMQTSVHGNRRSPCSRTARTTSRSASMPAAFVRGDAPTYSARPGANDVAAVDRRRQRDALDRAVASQRRLDRRPARRAATRAPIDIITATSSSTIAVSSTNTQSGMSRFTSSVEHLGAARAQRVAVCLVLSQRERRVDRLVADVRALAPSQMSATANA